MQLQWYEVLWAHVYSVPSKGYPVTRLEKVCSFGYGVGYWVQTGVAGGSRKGIHAFKDDKDLKKGQSIAPELLQAIEASGLSIWCLHEVGDTRNCAQTWARRVIPIFDDVDPLVVRKHSGCYDIAFAEHEYRFKENEGKMEEGKRWREGLTEVANLCGWDIFRPQYA
ncbi:hypothetical protein VIGAN_05043100 [Vigna angularis var. angularis]|uniref:ADP-ribosyl cyclase/cyclic ADP-ribose hydrolase n=1 Tax=Vigna angularis var. angularis TaxID=157739 RepID=A0A0S3S2N5_PHAAN|nr:disease resistance protein Roq1-like [Vigna angularis]BAT87090.1 hypothetical protein VIGAN_05043100 [Vigna angularis var. angularis]